MSDLRKVNPGDPFAIPARTYNAFIDAALAAKAGQFAPGGPVPTSGLPGGWCWVKNNSGAALDRFAVLGIDAPILAPSPYDEAFQNQVALAGVTSTSVSHTGNFVVLQEPLAAGALGLACISGVTVARVYVAGEGHRFADVKDGDATRLASGATGSARILWKESGTGQVWAVVRLAGSACLGDASDPYEMLPAIADILTPDAQTDTWDIHSQPAGKHGVKYRGPRTVYVHADKAAYVFTRDVIHDDEGNITSISAETKTKVLELEGHDPWIEIVEHNGKLQIKHGGPGVARHTVRCQAWPGGYLELHYDQFGHLICEIWDP